MNNARNARLLRIPIGQFHTFCRATSQTHSAPVTNPAISPQLVPVPPMVTAVVWNGDNNVSSSDMPPNLPRDPGGHLGVYRDGRSARGGRLSVNAGGRTWSVTVKMSKTVC